MKLSDINIRDPFVLKYNGKYYMYGTRGANTWERVEKSKLGFDVYVSEDLENWSEPKPIFEYYEGFWGTTQYWAPEVHFYNGKFYMLATFAGEECHRGTAIFVCDTPDGNFKEHSNGAVTPKDWECLDGTLYVEDGEPYMVFCHEWTQIGNGTVCAIKLSQDLKRAVSEPMLLWCAGDASWKRDWNGNESYVTDGPFLVKKGDRLISIWSSFTGENRDYCEAIARSSNGKINGQWSIDDNLVYKKDGGHGMIFTDYNNETYFVFHAPNDTPNERPCMRKIDVDMLLNNK